jgi:endonuclease/exonuclease/phosphatase family metal-dependent hydrolase
MKKILFLILSFSFIICLHAQSLNVMTFNIRLNTSADSLNAWPYRKDKAASQILFHDVNILGVQEALHDQMMDLQQRLPSFKYVGGGRDDGKQKGEYSAIFYDTARLQLLQTQTFWLSEQPTVPGSKGWDAAITRIVTWAKFKDRKTKKQFYAFNTHFDHMGKVARKESAKLLLKKIKEVAGSYPSIVTGDFNAQPSDEPIQVILDPTNPDRLTDSKSISATPHYGPTGTFNGFKQKETTDQPIDYIFVKNGGRVLKHATLSQTWEGRFSSDHFPVFAVIVL